MTCDEEALTEYLDGELPPARRGEVEEHLKACPACANTLELLKSASQAFKKHAAVPPAAGLADRLVPPPAPVREVRGRTPLLPLAGAALSLAGFMVVLGKMTKPIVSGILNQSMGMISGAAMTVGSEAVPGGSSGGGLTGVLLGFAAALAVFAYLAFRRRRP